MDKQDKLEKAARWLYTVKKGFVLKKEQLRKATEDYEKALKECDEKYSNELRISDTVKFEDDWVQGDYPDLTNKEAMRLGYLSIHPNASIK